MAKTLRSICDIKEDVLAILPGLKADRTRLKAELEAEEAPTNIIELKPKAVGKFREDVEQLADIVNAPGAEPSIELARAFREVVSGVIVHTRQPGEKYQYEIKGWLAAIVGEEL